MRLFKVAAMAAALTLLALPAAASSSGEFLERDGRGLYAAGVLVAQAAPAPVAATVVETPNAEAAPDIVSDTTVVLPVGTWVEQLTAATRDLAVAALGLALLWASRLLPEGIRQYINAERVKAAEQLLGKAVDMGFNAVQGATKGMKVEVNVGSKIVASGLQYAVDNGPGWLIGWLGGPEGIKEKLTARLDLVPEATSAAVIAGASGPKR